MRFKKSRKWLFLAMAMVFVSTNCWSAESFVISMSNDDYVDGRHKLSATSFSAGSGCGGKVLKFHKSDSWNGVRKDRIHIWGTGLVFREFVKISQDGFSRGAKFPISVYSDGDAKVCVNGAVRWVIAAQLAKSELDVYLTPQNLRSNQFIKMMVGSATYFVTATGAVVSSEISGVITLAAGTATATLITASITAVIEDHLPAADQYIKDNLYLWYSQEPQYENPCANPDRSYMKYQVKADLINPYLDFICGQYNPSSLVERYRDRGTCRLIANSSIDGKVWTYGAGCAPIEHNIANAVDYVNPGIATPIPDDPVIVTYPDQNFEDPSTNHKHAIGMHSVRGKLSGSSTWKYKLTETEGTTRNLDLRIKVKEKEKRHWTNVYVDAYYSPNRWFSRTHDTLLATKRIKTLDPKEKESRYFDNFDISDLEPGTHYYFADIRYGNKHNISSRKDKTEMLRLTILPVSDPEPVAPPYVFNSTQTCAGLTYDETDWTYTRENPKTTFLLGESIHVITEINNVNVNHRMKTEVYFNDQYWWTSGGNGAFAQVDDYWGNSYATFSQTAELVGVFTFKTFIDIGSGWESLSETFAKVEDDGTSIPYVYAGTNAAEGYSYDEATWIYTLHNPKTVFNLGESIYVFAEVNNITVDHKLKIEVYHNNNHWWTQEDSGFTNVEGVMEQSYAHLAQTAEEPGTFTFKVFLDIGSGWQQIDTLDVEVLGTLSPYQYIDTGACENFIYHDEPLWEYELVNPKYTFHLDESIHVITEINNVSVNHRFKIEVLCNGDLWWAEEEENFTVVESLMDKSYAHLSQGAEELGTFTFKVYLDTGEGFQYLDEINVSVIP